MKTAPLGICDLCGAQMPNPYTSKGKPRRYCSRQCRNTANSRAGNAERVRKLRASIAAGEWVNPRTVNPPDPAKLAAASRRIRLREVRNGTWRNPAMSDEARAKLSRPRKHDGPLAAAIEKLRRPGASVADLTPEERDAHAAYRRALYAARRAAQTPEQREEQRRKWREAWRRRQAQRDAPSDS